jgi:hypothetical protein
MTDGLTINVEPCAGMEDLRVYEITVRCAWYEYKHRVHHDNLTDAVTEAALGFVSNTTPPWRLRQ